MKWNIREVPIDPTSSEAKEDHLRLCIVYVIGGFDILTMRETARGYYLLCYPIQHRTDGIYIALGRGLRKLLKEADKHTEESLNEVFSIAKEKEQHLIESVCSLYNLKLIEQ